MCESILESCPMPACSGVPNVVCGLKHLEREFWVQCKTCGIRTPRMENKDDAVAFWNNEEKMKPLVEVQLSDINKLMTGTISGIVDIDITKSGR